MASPVPSAHGRLHKRGQITSNSFSPSTTSPPLNDVATLSYQPPTDTRRVLYEEPLEDAPRSGAPATAIKIRPYLRKLSLKDGRRVDLSKPAAENEGLAGLGIHDFGGVSRSAGDVRFESVSSGRSRHQRATSNGSQFSTASTSQRPSAPYMHPMRHTPRPYTPPIAKSYTTSVLDSEASDEAVDVVTDDDFRHRQPSRTLDYSQSHPQYRSDSISASMPAAPPSLHLHTSLNSSLTRLHNNPSQSSLTGSMPTQQRSRGGTLVSLETTSPSSRTSMDKALGFIRGNRSATADSDVPLDPVARAASIHAARLAYNEREEAKERKAEKEEARRLDRERKKLAGKEERQRRRSDAEEVKRARGDSSNEKVDMFAGKAYDDNKPAHARSLPAQVEAPPPRNKAQSERRAGRQGEGKRRGARSKWLSFMAWFRTRLLRLSRVMHMGG